jgi:hypothetical protein
MGVCGKRRERVGGKVRGVVLVVLLLQAWNAQWMHATVAAPVLMLSSRERASAAAAAAADGY